MTDLKNILTKLKKKYQKDSFINKKSPDIFIEIGDILDKKTNKTTTKYQDFFLS